MQKILTTFVCLIIANESMCHFKCRVRTSPSNQFMKRSTKLQFIFRLDSGRKIILHGKCEDNAIHCISVSFFRLDVCRFAIVCIGIVVTDVKCTLPKYYSIEIDTNKDEIDEIPPIWHIFIISLSLFLSHAHAHTLVYSFIRRLCLISSWIV